MTEKVYTGYTTLLNQAEYAIAPVASYPLTLRRLTDQKIVSTVGHKNSTGGEITSHSLRHEFENTHTSVLHRHSE